MLTGREIIKCVNNGSIMISDFDMKRINPNSYNIRLSKYLYVYDMKACNGVLDPKANNLVSLIEIPEDGYILQPGILYLGSTVERTQTDEYITGIDGRSSIGRLGIRIHATAGFGDIGFRGNWTLEIDVIHPVKVYPNMEIGQIYFTKPTGDDDIKYEGRYQNAIGAEASKMYL